MWDQRLVRLALSQHLRAAYGIKVKGDRGQCDRRRRETATTEIVGKIFGVPFNALPHSLVPEYGHIPSFLVDACTSLEEHIHTEGLFRKSGSVIRLKALKNKLDHGESCLSSAPPCDIAGLLKLFFRELPEPLLPVDLHEALFKAQQLGTEEKNKATLLLSCLMTDHTIDILRYLFNFLRNVSLRSSENKMDSSNLAVIFAPNLLQTSEGHEKMSANTEKKLRLQAAVVQTFIDYASDIGHVPDFILEKIPAMLGIDGLCATQSLEGFEEGECESPGDCKRKRRQSVGDFVSGALNKLKPNRTPSVTPQQERIAQLSVSPVILTPNAKRKLPVDSSQGFSSKKRKSIKHNFNLELLPSNLFSSSSTPVSVHFDASPEGSSQSSFSPVAISGNNLISTDVRRRSKRIASKKVCRVESGKASCFSPKISRKEKVRRSLRLKFSLGKSSKDVNGCSGVNRCENVGRRLANQQSLKTRIESVKTGLLFSPDIDERLTKKGSKKISKSEENLLTPERLDGTSYRMSWTGPSNSSFQVIDAHEASPIEGNLEVENSSLEPDSTVEKSPVSSYELTPSNVHNNHNNNRSGSSLIGDENGLTTETLVKIQKAFSETGSNLHALINHRQSSVTNVGKVKLNETSSMEHSLEKNLLETNDSTVIESNEHHTNKDENSSSERDFSLHQTQKSDREATIKCYSTQIKMKCEESIHSHIPKDHLSNQELPSDEQIKKQQSPRDKLNTKLKENESMIEENLLKCAASREDAANASSSEQITCNITNLSKPRPVRIVKQQSLVERRDKTVSEGLQRTEHGKVSDHIQWFNKLSLNEPNRAKVKSPLKFQRTPVRQSVRRINSLLEYGRQPIRHELASLSNAASPLIKSVSCDSALSSGIESTKSKDSSISCTKSGPKEQKSIPCEQSNVDAVSKSSMKLTSKSFSQIKRHPDSVSASLGSTRVCKQEVISDGQIKIPLDDLTNHNVLKSVVNNNMGFSGINNRILRKPSERERMWYKGSPKNPIGKVQLLPTSKPVDL
ncbi:PREDICTED: rho GTPase-activating protein 11A isoform X1 [Ceratotherium simum simum]|uniref:Rho GTPase-activating protein 11A isoform X1 n=1 Tax=Ceratotherium simum simum TaxID=73337 RepID=A0ABM0H7X9_CERSS|nr:PREDICTED: rho GTPase-activating protein 11A isoform X1 [Ceratotherium simum simum]